MRSVVYEFDQDVLIHNLSVGISPSSALFKVEVVYPLSFSSSTVAEVPASIFDNTGSSPVQSTYFSPFSLSAGAYTNAPLPHALPKGSLIQITFSGAAETVAAEVFLVASAASNGGSHYY